MSGPNYVMVSGLMKRGMATYNGEEVFDKILIANRGEIACRVISTAKKMGIKTVQIFSEPDRYSRAVEMADEAYCVGPAASAESYLNIPRIMEVIKETGAQAVHPGYGFLSENHLFAEELEKNGISFIGPGSFAITSMGDKITSKQLAIDAGVNTVPGSLAVVKEDKQILEIANEIGYPVMIKATAGGGGKGMRIAWNDEEALEGFKLSSAEAKASFADDRIFIEKFVEEPRHIEIQIVADKHGNVAALPERECSIQRRNQKVLEEAPSSFIDPETRRKMQDQAIQLAKAVDYCSAGTVEMLCDKHKNFYFLEMNTRLQVEHPITELVAGVDLVEQMIRVAAGHKLSDELLSRDRPILGWAHEARVYAEDPLRGFLPSIGRLNDYEEPTLEHVDGVRVDTGVRQGDEISMHYDPMISKLITHGQTREEALDRLELALDNYVVRGLGNNLNFLRECTRHERFRSGNINTDFIAHEYPDGFKGVVLTSDENLTLAVITFLTEHIAFQTEQLEETYQECAIQPSRFVNIGDNKYLVSLNDNGQISLRTQDGVEKFFEVDAEDFDYVPGNNIIRCNVNGEDCIAQIIGKTPLGYNMQFCGATAEVTLLSEKEAELSQHMLPKPEIDMAKWLLSPMPGKLISVDVKEGQKVFAGQALAVVEAMKMQNVLRAEKDGIIGKVLVKDGATLAVDEEIIEFQ